MSTDCCLTFLITIQIWPFPQLLYCGLFLPYVKQATAQLMCLQIFTVNKQAISILYRQYIFILQYSPGIESLAGSWDKNLCAEQILLCAEQIFLIDHSIASSSLSQLYLPSYSQWAFIRNSCLQQALDKDCEEKNGLLGKKATQREEVQVFMFSHRVRALEVARRQGSCRGMSFPFLTKSIGISNGAMPQEGSYRAKHKPCSSQESLKFGEPGFPKAFSKCSLHWSRMNHLNAEESAQSSEHFVQKHRKGCPFGIYINKDLSHPTPHGSPGPATAN